MKKYWVVSVNTLIVKWIVRGSFAAEQLVGCFDPDGFIIFSFFVELSGSRSGQDFMKSL